jgi:hypothetical protein
VHADRRTRLKQRLEPPAAREEKGGAGKGGARGRRDGERDEDQALGEARKAETRRVDEVVDRVEPRQRRHGSSSVRAE